MAEVTVRRFREGDAQAFRRLNEEWLLRYFTIEPKDVELLGDPATSVLAAGGEILIAEDAETAVGCCALLPHGEGRFEIGKMAVTASHQGRGIGRQLMARCIEEARSRGAASLYLETNSKLAPALALYEAFGFQRLPPEAREPSPYVRSDVAMVLDLR